MAYEIVRHRAMADVNYQKFQRDWDKAIRRMEREELITLRRNEVIRAQLQELRARMP
jgi:hypothetical protein